jgi:hypothetical protein
VELLANAHRPSRNLLPADPLSRLASGFFFPEYFGRPDKVDLGGTKTTLASFYAGRAAYIGALPLMLAAGGLAVRRNGVQVFFLVAGAAALLPVISTPLSRAVTRIPGFSLTAPHYLIFLTIFALAVLAAFGLQAALEADAVRRRRMLAVMAVAGLTPMIWPLAKGYGPGVWRDALDQLPTLSSDERSADVAAAASVLRWALVAALGLAVVWLAGRARDPRRPALLAIGALALASVDLVTINRGFHPAVDRALADQAPPPAVSFVRARVGDRRVAGEAEALAPNVAQRYGLADARAEELPPIERYVRLYTGLGGVFDQATGRTRYSSELRPDPRLLSLFGVRYVFDQDTGGRRRLPIAFDRPEQRVLRNPDALPRAWMAYSWRTAPGRDEALAATLRSSLRDLRDRPVVEGVPAAAARAAGPASAARVRQTPARRLRIEVRARRPGYLVLDDLFYPGWKATVDGRGTPIRAADGAFRAVRVGAGRHRVEFSYAPGAIRVGGLLTLLAALSLAGVLVAGWLRRGRRQDRSRRPRRT